MKTFVFRWFALVCLLFFPWGCMHVAERRVPPGGMPLPEGYRIGDIVNTQTGKVIPLESLVDELSRVEVVYVGETHTSVEDHRVQEEVLRRLHARNPSLALGMEMFPREVQPVLDGFSGGLLSEDAFIKEVNWERVWGYPFRLYRSILMFAQEKRVPVLGLNAPKEMVSKIATSGLSALTTNERARVARDFHLDDSKHREYVRKEYTQHIKETIKSFDTFFEAQLAWEETMAETLAQRLGSSRGKERIVVLVGKGHISDRVGLPMLTSKRFAHTYKTVAPVPIDYPLRIADPDIADYVWVTDKSEFFHRGRLGIMIRALASGDGIEVLSVFPQSPAEKAGMKKGDVILKVDGVPMKNLDDLHKAMARTGAHHELSIRRGTETLTVTIAVSQ